MAGRGSTSLAAPDPTASAVRDSVVLLQGYVVEFKPSSFVIEVAIGIEGSTDRILLRVHANQVELRTVAGVTRRVG